MKNVLHAKYYDIHMKLKKKYILFKPDLRPKSSNAVFPKIHGIDIVVNPNLRPEKQVLRPLESHVLTESKVNFMQNQELVKGEQA